jgi:3-oxoacyl-[acyl-carrier-protein] synthase-3
MPKCRAIIRGVDFAVPAGTMTNADFEKILDTSDEWITQRTGMKVRHIVGEGESTATLAIDACRKVLAKTGVDAGDLDLIICATISPEMPYPATACFIQQALDCGEIPAFDISAACSGFVYGLSVATQFIETGAYKRILLVGAESMTRTADFTDRGTCILFGDGAGAALIEATNDLSKGVQYLCLKADGNGWDLIHQPGGGSRIPATHESVEAREHFTKMKGREVYKFAVAKMQWLIGHCMEAQGLTVDDIDLVVPHQVNMRIINSATQRFGFPREKVFVNIEKYGNTSSASVPIALAEALQQGRITEGSTVLLAAFGAGLTWAGAVIRF